MKKVSGVFLVRGDHGFTRIIYTKNLKSRLAAMHLASPFALTVVGRITNSKTATAMNEWLAERGEATAWNPCAPQDVYYHLLHAFRVDHVRGDWYKLNEQTVKEMPLEKP